MRALTLNEMTNVSGAGNCCSCPPPPPPCTPTPDDCDSDKRSHANNGFGNGAHDGVPGRSGKTDATR